MFTIKLTTTDNFKNLNQINPDRLILSSAVSKEWGCVFWQCLPSIVITHLLDEHKATEAFTDSPL